METRLVERRGGHFSVCIEGLLGIGVCPVWGLFLNLSREVLEISLLISESIVQISGGGIYIELYRYYATAICDPIYRLPNAIIELG